MTQQISGCRLRKLPLWNLGELQFEFLELSDQFEHEVKAVGLQLKIMVTSQCPSNDTYATRCLTRDCSNVSNVEGTCLYKMIVIGSLQDYFPTQRNIAWAQDYMRSLYWLVHSGLADMKIYLPRTTGIWPKKLFWHHYWPKTYSLRALLKKYSSDCALIHANII